jgi:hypothetical protein
VQHGQVEDTFRRTFPQTYQHKELLPQEAYTSQNSNLCIALPSGCWYAVQVMAPVAAVVPILTLEEHDQDNHKSAT